MIYYVVAALILLLAFPVGVTVASAKQPVTLPTSVHTASLEVARQNVDNLYARRNEVRQMLQVNEQAKALMEVFVARGLPGKLGLVLQLQARDHGIDPWDVMGVIEVESAWDPKCVSIGAGEQISRGLMQLNDNTAPWLAKQARVRLATVADIYDPEANIRMGSWYLAFLLRRYGDRNMALAAYNLGMGAAERERTRHGTPGREYVGKIDEARGRLRQFARQEAAH